MMLRTLVASAALALSLTGFSAEGVDPPPGHYPTPGAPRPACYGVNEQRTVWNLVTPVHVYSVDSCRAAVLVSQRNLAGNYANYVALVAARIPGAMPITVYALAWNTGNGVLAQCAARGTGVTFSQSSQNGMVLGCSAQ